MKIWLNKITILCLFTLALFSCDKDEDRIIIQEGIAPSLSTSKTSVVLNKDDAANKAITLNWTPAEYGYAAAVNYSIQYDVAGNNFASPSEIIIANATEKTLTVKELNALAGKLKLPYETASDMQFRVKADISPEVAPVFSAPVTVSVVPYLDIIDYASLYVPGQYQSWKPELAPKISSLSDNGIYEGYVYMGSGIAKGFKFTSKPGWDGTNYGADGATKLSTDGGAGNLKVSEPGFYLLKANTNALTWSALKTQWAVTGSATPKGWVNDNVTDHDMTYDEIRGVWTITLSLSEGEIKFRANDGWDLNYGDNKPADGFLDKSSNDNIKVAESGTYEIILDLRLPGYYSYTLNKK
ncbi:SusE domain-containing protein [Pontibacter oryzae]|nr:SusE domain-containing protein [Pontibacter oryzae]